MVDRVTRQAQRRTEDGSDPRSLAGVLLGFLKVRRHELRGASLYFLYLLFAVGVIILGRNVAAALFLTSHGASALPWMYVASAASVSLVAWAYSRVTGRVRLDRLIEITLGALILLLAAMRTAMWLEAPFVYALLYVVVEVMGAILIIQFWSLATATHHTREAKRLFGFIGAGGMLANIVVGFGGAALVLRIGTENLIFVMIVCLLACGLLVGILGSAGRQQLLQALDGSEGTARKSRRALSRQTLRVFSSRHLRLVAVIVALTFVVTTLVDFQFKTLAHGAYEKEALTAFFSLLYGITGVVALFVQLFVTGRLLERYGVLLALSLLPLFLFLGSMAIFLVPLALVAAFAKGSDAVFRYSVNDVTLQLLYLPVPQHSRMKAKAFIDGILKPAAYGLTGLGLAAAVLLVPRLAERVHWLALVSAAVAALWLLVVTRLRGEYLRSLVETLHLRRLDLEEARAHLDDASASIVLGAALESEEEAEILRALELLRQIEGRLLEERVAALLDHPSPSVRREALAHLGRWASFQWSDRVRDRFEDEVPAVRAAAIESYCAIGREKAVREAGPFLEDPEPEVRASAVGGMIRYGGLDGILASGEALEEMLGSSDASLRLHGAKVLGDTGLRGFYQPLVKLMSDEDPLVTRAAIASAGRLRSPELVPVLIYKLGHPRMGAEAADALVAHGPGIENALAKVLAHEKESPAVRSRVPRVLGHLGTQRASTILMEHVGSKDEDLRTRSCRWLNRLHTRFSALRVDQRRVRAVIDEEIRAGYETIAMLDALGLDDAPLERGGLLAMALEERLERLVDRVFLLLALRFPARTMEAARAGLESEIKAIRGNALEVLENTLDRDMRARFLPLVDERPRRERLLAARLVLKARASPDRERAIDELLGDSSPWIRACALAFLSSAEAPDRRVGLLARDLTRCGSALVREVALGACKRHLPSSEAASLIEECLHDQDQGVRALASALAAGVPAGESKCGALAV